MGLEHLPEELLIIILKQLDLESVYNLYYASIPHVQNVISSGYLKKLDISLSTMATINTLMSQFFIGISTNLQELDLKGVQDLTRKALVPAVMRMKNLATLNVAYTNITIFDFLQIYDHCSSIKNICIDYQFVHSKDEHFSQELLSKCQDVFANMESVHFVGSEENLLQSSLPEIILQKTNLIRLTYTLARNDDMMTYYRYLQCDPIKHNNFNVFAPKWRSFSFHIYGYNAGSKMVKDILSTYEFLQIHESSFMNVECSSIFKTFLEQYFKLKPTVMSTWYKYYPGDTIAFMCWNKQTTTFDEAFFKQLFLVLMPLFPCKLYPDDEIDSEEEETEELAPLTSDWIWVKHHGLRDYDAAHMYQFPTKRLLPSYYNLDYDNLLRAKQNVELNICFSFVECPVKLSSRSNFLVKLTYLSLSPSVTFSPDFFNVLFRYCTNLVTLNVETKAKTDCSGPISKYISLSQSLRNFRLRANDIKFQKLFSRSGLCLCRTLQNVIIVDVSTAHTKHIGKAEQLITYCEKLYYLCIEINTDDKAIAKRLMSLNKTKKNLGRNHLRVELIDSHYKYKYSCDPFLEVFKLCRIKSLQF